MLFRTILLVPSLLASLTACAFFADNKTAGENPALRAEVVELFDRFESLLVSRNLDELESLLADDLSYSEPGVPVLSKAELMERERRSATANPVSTLEYDVISVKEAGDVIAADVTLDFETRIPQGKEEVLFTGTIEQTVEIIRKGDGLRFLSVTVTRQDLFRNGELAVGAEAIDEMHAGE